MKALDKYDRKKSLKYRLSQISLCLLVPVLLWIFIVPHRATGAKAEKTDRVEIVRSVVGSDEVQERTLTGQEAVDCVARWASLKAGVLGMNVGTDPSAPRYDVTIYSENGKVLDFFFVQRDREVSQTVFVYQPQSGETMGLDKLFD